MMDNLPCSKCGAIMDDSLNRHYWYCFRHDWEDKGCNTLWAKTDTCFFIGFYVLNDSGEIIAYKQTSYEGGKIIRTNKLLQEYRGWKLG